MSKWNRIARVALLASSVIAGLGQTAVDLRTQTKNVDFSAAANTRPVQTGNALPSICTTGQMFFLTTAAAGANLYGCVAPNTWSPESGGGTGGGGATTAGKLGDFAVTQANGTTLSIGGMCAPTSPCSVRFGTQIYTFLFNGSVTVSGGTGTAFIYISSTGVLTVGHNLTGNCDYGCVAQGGVTAFPLDSIPLYTWTATNGAWDANGGMDRRAFLSSQVLGTGPGLQMIQTAGQNTVSVDPSVVGLRVGVPASATSSCVAGTWAANASFYYICVNTNTWVRAALSGF